MCNIWFGSYQWMPFYPIRHQIIWALLILSFMDAFRWCLRCLFLYPYYHAPFWLNDHCTLQQKKRHIWTHMSDGLHTHISYEASNICCHWGVFQEREGKWALANSLEWINDPAHVLQGSSINSSVNGSIFSSNLPSSST